MKKLINYIKDIYRREDKDKIFKDFDKKYSFLEVFLFIILIIVIFSVIYIFLK